MALIHEDYEKRECIYSNNTWMIIRRVTDQGIFFSAVRKYEKSFTQTFVSLTAAIHFVDTEV